MFFYKATASRYCNISGITPPTPLTFMFMFYGILNNDFASTYMHIFHQVNTIRLLPYVLYIECAVACNDKTMLYERCFAKINYNDVTFLPAFKIYRSSFFYIRNLTPKTSRVFNSKSIYIYLHYSSNLIYIRQLLHTFT